MRRWGSDPSVRAQAKRGPAYVFNTIVMNEPGHLIIVGGGPAGYVGAPHAVAHGLRVTLIEAGKKGYR